MPVEALAAFVGGLLSLLSPCSALLLPAFFAYAFPSRGQLVARTGVFYLGLLTLFVPLGLGVGVLSGVFLEHRAEVSLIAGLLLIGIGGYQLAVGGFELPGANRLAGGRFGASGESLAATYVLGLVYGIGGFCSGPLLGGVLTIAGTSGGALSGALLLAVFAAGMAAPMLVLALVWERLGASGRNRLRGREVQIGPVRRHVSVVASSVMFIVLGVGFIAFQGSNALGGLYQALGLTGLATSVEDAVASLAASAPWVLAFVVAVPAAAILLLVVRRPGSRPDGEREAAP
ncbi:MAG: cytochrome c biogenesis CcdA family protein [Chloroflexota bacterium]